LTPAEREERAEEASGRVLGIKVLWEGLRDHPPSRSFLGLLQMLGKNNDYKLIW
jgi:hypothetical protein